LGLKSAAEWVRYCGSGKKPLDIPASPEVAYRRQGWVSLGDWLGTGTVATHRRVYRSFKEARRFARSLRLSSNTEWREYLRRGTRPQDIHAVPDRYYLNRGWISWADWLGTRKVYPKHIKWWPFDKARAFVHQLGFRNQSLYFNYCKSAAAPLELPHAPHIVYAEKGWTSWGDWLGTAFVATRQRQYRPFHDARAFARSLHLADLVAWKAYCGSGELPDDIPRKPELVYRKRGWKGVRDWLDVPAKRRSFADARTFARSLCLQSMREWLDYCDSGRKPEDIPRYPFSTYRKDWVSWPDWLGYAPRKAGSDA
jgi:hypothetical protein